MGQADYFKKGDFNRICDRCGLKRKASDTKREWTGLIVCSDGCWEARHPQERVRGRRDRQRVPYPRPDSAPTFLEPTDVTADDL